MQAYSIASNERGVFIYIDAAATTKRTVDDIIQYIGTRIEHEEERDEWIRFAAQNLDRAYSDNEPDYSDAPATKVNPFFRLGFLATIPQSNIQKVIGSISLERHNRLLRRLCQYFLSSSSTL